MIDYLSPREESELRAAAAAGEDWPRVIVPHFLDGARLRLGWDEARLESDILPGMHGERRRAAVAAASRWCAEHGLHLLSFEGDGPGADPVGERRHFMAVG